MWGDGKTSVRDFPVKSVKGEEAAWTRRPEQTGDRKHLKNRDSMDKLDTRI